MAAITSLTEHETEHGKDDQGWTLGELATRINKAMDDAGAADDMANDRRIAAGRMLKVAKARVAHGYFKKWCERNINKSRADVYRCLALVGEDDPFKQREARVAEKAKAREAMAVSRERHATVTAAAPQIPVSNVSDTPASQPSPPAARPSNIVPLARTPKDAVDRLEKLYVSFKGAWKNAYDAEVAGSRDAVANAWKLAAEAFTAIYHAT